MAIPTARATSIRYKGVEYPFGTPITVTELNPTINITFDNSDFQNAMVRLDNGVDYGYLEDGYLQTRQYGITVISPTELQYVVPVWLNITSLKVQSSRGGDGLGSERAWDIIVDLTTGVNTSWQTLGRVIIQDTLLGNMTSAEITAITENVNGVDVVKIFWEGADEQFDSPYIIMSLMTGGDKNSSQAEYAEMLWRVAVFSKDLSTISLIENAIHNALTRQTPIVNYSGITATEIDEMFPVTDRYQVQQTPLYSSGGIYRIRLCK